jgi:hypothetical protein
MDGKALLYVRPQSVQWQVRFKLANNKWHSTTTNTADIEQAKINAIAIIETVKIKTDAGLAITTKIFKQIALDEITNKSRALDNNTGRRCYRDYIFVINKYLIPFLAPTKLKRLQQRCSQILMRGELRRWEKCRWQVPNAITQVHTFVLLIWRVSVAVLHTIVLCHC